jgi:capsular polysaccharide biosynthesis protein
MRFKLDVAEAGEAYKALHEGFAGARPLPPVDLPFTRPLPAARFIVGEDLIPDYSRNYILKDLTADHVLDAPIEIDDAILIGRRFVIVNRQMAAYNHFREGKREPVPWLEPSIKKDTDGAFWLEADDAEVTYLSGRYALGYWDASDMYHHYVFECISRILALAGDPRYDDVKFLFPAPIQRFVLSSLAFFGIDESRIVGIDIKAPTQVETLIAMPVPRFNMEWCPAGYLDLIRTRALDIIKTRPPRQTPEKILFTRRDALNNERLLVNEQALIDALCADGFVPLTPGELTFEEQILYTHQAREILCVHGSAGANLVFCAERARVLHLFPDCVHYFYTHGVGTAVAGADYGYVFGPSFERSNRLHNNPWVLSPGKIKQALALFDRP